MGRYSGTLGHALGRDSPEATETKTKTKPIRAATWRPAKIVSDRIHAGHP
jgi:hypothetical protein